MGSQDQFVSTQQAVATAIGVDRHTVKQWLAEGAPGKTSKGYDIAAIAEWRDLNKRKYGDDWRDIEGITEDEYKARMSIAKLRKAEGEALKYESEARIKEHEAQKTTEDVVHLDDVERFMAGVFAETRRLLDRLPMEMKNTPAINRPRHPGGPHPRSSSAAWCSWIRTPDSYSRWPWALRKTWRSTSAPCTGLR